MHNGASLNSIMFVICLCMVLPTAQAAREVPECEERVPLGIETYPAWLQVIVYLFIFAYLSVGLSVVQSLMIE